jgi:hypothetical protein
VNRKVITAAIILFMVFVGFQFAGPAAAVKVIDKDTKYFNSPQSGPMKVTWKTYKYSNYLKVFATYYVKDSGKYVVSWHDIFTLKKVSRTKIKITDTTDNELHPGTTVRYDNTRLTITGYYWKVFRQMLY